MNSQERILKLLQIALIEIRFQSRSENCEIKSIELLSNLFHNVPMALLSSSISNDELLQQIIQNSQSHSGLHEWVISNLES